ncbi:MAG: hypothetical protein GY710_22470 [Desulfobacteraceae bacterium]|nr:hypothetical protein [Desulfobacteraceae bacterium]
MNKKIPILFFAVFFILSAGKGEAFVPQTPHLLYLMIHKIKRPAGMEVFQTRNVMDVSGQEVEAGNKTIALDEKLTYLFPGKFRSEIISGTVSWIYVESDSQFIKVADGRVVSLEKSPGDFYTDILLYRDQKSLGRQLMLAGVDTDQVSFQRLDDKICYFIGQLPLDLKVSPGLWIDKKSLLPVRYVIKKNGRIIVFDYENWQRVSQTWYPMQTTIFVDNQLSTKIDVRQFKLVSRFPAALFDVNRIQELYHVRDGFHKGIEGAFWAD